MSEQLQLTRCFLNCDKQWVLFISAFILEYMTPTLLVYDLPTPHRKRGGLIMLVRSSPDQVVRVRTLVGHTALCSFTKHFTLISPTSPLSTQVY